MCVSVSALTLVIAHIDLYLYNPHQASASYPLLSIDASVNADADADAECGQGLTRPDLKTGLYDWLDDTHNKVRIVRW